MINAESGSRVASAWDFRLIRTYYQEKSLGVGAKGSNGLLNCELVAYLIELFENALSHGNLNDGLLSVFYDSPCRIRTLKKDADDMDLE
jgi:hypothetical protein